jgi:hypothetical protein
MIFLLHTVLGYCLFTYHLYAGIDAIIKGAYRVCQLALRPIIRFLQELMGIITESLNVASNVFFTTANEIPDDLVNSLLVVFLGYEIVIINLNLAPALITNEIIGMVRAVPLLPPLRKVIHLGMADGAATMTAKGIDLFKIKPQSHFKADKGKADSYFPHLKADAGTEDIGIG